MRALRIVAGSRRSRAAFCVVGLSTLLAAAGCRKEASDTKPQPEPAASVRAGAVSATRYTCPMHPEIVSNQPGRCLHCRMDLVPLVKP